MEVAEIKQECEQAIECFMCKEIFQNYTDFEEHQNDQCIITVRFFFTQNYYLTYVLPLVMPLMDMLLNFLPNL